MPLLRKDPFIPEKPPSHLQPSDEVFLCQYTNEIFTDYELFFERSILCNSLVWSCSLTGKSNMTYEEAAQSEQSALQVILETISPELRKFIIYLTSLTKRKKFNDIVDDVHIYLKDRYIVGEPVEAIIKNKWYACKVISVIPPTKDEVEKYLKEEDEDGEIDKKSRDRDESIAMWGNPPELFKFEVEEEDAGDAEDLSATYVVPWSGIRREKGFYTRDKLRTYIKYITSLDKESGVYVLRETVIRSFNPANYKFEQNFPAKVPEFEVETGRVKTVDKVKNAASPKKPAGLVTPQKNGKALTPLQKTKLVSPMKNGKLVTPLKEAGGKTVPGAGDKTPSDLKKEKAAYDGIADELKRPLIFLLSLFKKYGINSIFEELYQYVKDRMFIGEDQIEAIVRSKWRPVKIVDIVAPTEKQVAEYSAEQDQDPDINKKVRDETVRVWGPQPELFNFVVIETEPDHGHEKERTTVSWDCIKREKMALTREKLRLMTRYVMYFDEEAGYYKVKDEFLRQFDVENRLITSFFKAKEPEFEVSIKPKTAPKQVSTPALNGMPISKKVDSVKKAVAKSEQKGPGKMEKKVEKKGEDIEKETAELAEKERKLQEKKVKKVVMTKDEVNQMEEEMQKVRVQREKLQEEHRQREEKKRLELMESRIAEKHRKTEEKKRQAEIIREWKKPREDLELEDLKELPVPRPVRCRIPNALFGDFLMILEFLHVFVDEIELKDDFTHGVTFEVLERAIVEKEVLGPFNDLLQVMLRAVFSLQEQENEEVKEDGAGSGDTYESKSTRMTYGAPLQKLSMDALSLTEMLRLHILQSGSKTSDSNAKWRFQQRGGYTSEDDPGYQFKLEEPQILQTLATQTVFELSMGEKLKILKCLSLQILTYAAIRDVLDERFHQLHSARNDIRNLLIAENKRQREFMADKTKQIEEDRTRDPPLTPEQVEARKLKWERDDQAEKAAYLKNQARLKDVVDRLELITTNHEPLGIDRAYRRFWTFASFPGLFVEHDDEFVGPCLPNPTPYCKPQVVAAEVAQQQQQPGPLQQKKSGDIRNYFGKKEEKQEENETITIDDDVMLIKNSFKDDKPMTNGLTVEKEEVEEYGTETKSRTFGLCTANPDTCHVHATYLTKTVWSFFEATDELDQLIENLHDRGIRESHLKKSLATKRDHVKEMIASCPVHMLDETKEPAVVPDKKGRKKKDYDSTLGYPEGTPITEILEQEFRDMILDLEDKIYVGSLGALKVKDREAWRKAIENKGYDRQTDKLKWGGKLQHKGLSSISGTPMKDVKLDRPDSRGSEGSFGLDDVDDTVSVNPVVKDLACSLLQVSQSVEEKFIKKPLGEEEKEKKKRLKLIEDKKGAESADSPPSEASKLRSPRERWEISLLNCTSLPQLFLHYSSLDASIEWKKSVEKVRCRQCRKKSDPEKLLLCDSCNKGCHTFCLKPPLSKIPVGDWFCKDCQPKEKARTPRKARRLFSEEEAEESGAEEQEETDEVSETEVLEVCTNCSEPGEVILCDTCPNMYHLTCLDPPLRKPPRGKWSCPDCLNPRPKRGQQKTRGRAKTVATDKPDREGRKRKAVKTLDFDESDDDIAGRIVPKRKAAEKAEEKVKKERKRIHSEPESDEDESEVRPTPAKPGRKRRSPINEEPTPKQRRSEPVKRSVPTPVSARSERLAATPVERNKRRSKKVSESESEVEVTPAPPARKRKSPAREEKKTTEKRKSASSRSEKNAKYLSAVSESESEAEGPAPPARKRKSPAKEEKKTSEKRKPVSARLEKNAKAVSESESETEASALTARKRKSPAKEEKKTSEKRKSVSARVEKNAKAVSESESEDEAPAPPARKRKSLAQEEKKTPEKRKSDSSRPEKNAKSNNNMSLDVEIVEGILDALTRHKDCWPFMSPVKKSAAPDYHKLIRVPMDLGTVRRKLYDNKYKSNTQVFADVLLTFGNCEQYNQENTEEYKCGLRLRKFFEKQVQDLGFELPQTEKMEKKSRKR